MCAPQVTLTADAWEVKFRSDVTLYCFYDLEGLSLLSMKWYRGTREFFRYDPSLRPHTKTFPIFNTKVDLNRSNETQVTLQEVGYELDGKIKCEVTIDHIYKVISAQEYLSVISLPKEKPKIVTNKEKYNINDTLLANCTSSLSHPPSSLSFLLNNEPVGMPVSKHIGCNETEKGFPTIPCENNDNTTVWTWLPLNLTLLESHFRHDNLNLQCTAVINNFRHSSAKKIIPLKSSEPKPERVRSSLNSSSRTDCSYHFVLFIVFWILNR
ncbi:uncharacterized protein LOC135840558 isoform X2 [Planococcus citri]